MIIIVIVVMIFTATWYNRNYYAQPSIGIQISLASPFSGRKEQEEEEEKKVKSHVITYEKICIQLAIRRRKKRRENTRNSPKNYELLITYIIIRDSIVRKKYLK